MKSDRQKADPPRREGRRNIYLTIYIIIVVVLAYAYFTVPERTLFFENQLEWWREMWKVIKPL